MTKKKIKGFQFYGRDVVALAVLAGLFYCKIVGLNGVIDAMLALIIGYYFSKRVYEETQK